jgi:hypothetical protein
MRSILKIALFALLPSVLSGALAAADPFGRVERAALVEPPAQVYVNPYAAPSPARLPEARLTALGRAVRVGNLDVAYRASASNGSAMAPGKLPMHQVARPLAPPTSPLVPAASANAPATISRDRSVVPAAFDVEPRTVAVDRFDAANPLRRVDSPADRSSNPLR